MLIEGRYFLGRDRLLKLLLRLVPEAPSKYGIRLKPIPGDLTNFMSIFGSYSDVIPSHIRSLASRSAFLDIGANQGLFSILASKRLENGIVIAFEPNPRIFSYLLENLRINSCSNVVPLNIAVGEEDAVLNLSHDNSHSGASHLMMSNTAGRNRNSIVRVPVINPVTFSFLTRLLQWLDVHVKVDVEGFEVSVLRSLLQTQFAPRIQSVVVEIDAALLRRFGSTPSQIYSLMTSAGFRATVGENSGHYDEIFTK
jgi:FkbM family methyltransferase